MYKKVMDASFKRLDSLWLTSAEVEGGIKDLLAELVKAEKRINATQPSILFCHSLLLLYLCLLPHTRHWTGSVGGRCIWDIVGLSGSKL